MRPSDWLLESRTGASGDFETRGSRYPLNPMTFRKQTVRGKIGISQSNRTQNQASQSDCSD